MNITDILDMVRLPRLDVNLMYEKTADNDPFFQRVVRNFYAEANSRHPKVWLIPKYKYGFTVCELPRDFDAYFMNIEASARRNHRKAARLGYQMRRFDYNAHLADIREIWLSTPVRQGLLPEEIRQGQVRPGESPTSKTSFHDYPSFGVFKERKLCAYACCMVAGEICTLNDLYGHSQFQGDGIVPFLIVEIAREMFQSYPNVKYFSYGTYFGASETLRRFKRKFLFNPYKVTWHLGSTAGEPEERLLVYRADVSEPPAPPALSTGRFVLASEPGHIGTHWGTWVRNWGVREAAKAALKVLSGKRMLFAVLHEDRVIQSGWINVGFCRHYPVERDAVVLGTLWTAPDLRGQGLAPASIRAAVAFCVRRGYRRFYIDADIHNRSSQRMIEKTGLWQRLTSLSA